MAPRQQSAFPEISSSSPASVEERGPEAPTRAPSPAGQRHRVRCDLLPLALAAVLIGTLYWQTAVALAAVWNVDPNYSHGFLVPLISLIFALVAWKRFGSPVRRDVGAGAFLLGMLEIALGLVLHAAGWFAGSLLLDVLSLIFVLRGTLLALGGRPANRAFGFAALFLVFMAPLPMAWYQPLAIWMQQVVSAVSAQLLEICGAAVYREGYVIHLPGYAMEVGQACSGLRQLTAIFALAVAIAHFSRRGRLFRGTLVLLSLPIAIAANCARVLTSGVVMMLFGPRWAEGVYHTLEGLAIVGVAAVLVVAAAAGLAHLEDHFRRAAPRTVT
jgi:exosortase